ncbi:MAG: AbrB/MazE/SpoVT family DNA-binding domain-containing protein, partial [Gammaproteobacteria bacterium]
MAASVEYIATTRMGEKGQLTIPKGFRDDLDLTPGVPVSVLRIGNGLILIPEHTRFRQLCNSIASTLQSKGITPKAVLATLPEAR